MSGAPPLAVMAADRMGVEIVRRLVASGERIALLVLDPGDRGGANAEIEALHAASPLAGPAVRFERGESDSVARAVRGAGADLGVLAWWPHIVRGALAAAPRRGWLNLHPGLLPWNRGKHPNFWCVVEGTPCGVTLHLIDDGVDTGPVLAQREIEVTWEDTGGTLHARLREAGLALFDEAWPGIRDGTIPARPQDPAAGTTHRAAEIDAASRIDLDRRCTGRELLDLLRARTYPPHPGAWFEDGGRRYEVEIRIRRVESHGA